jgi:hypothetical protein
VHYSDTHKMAGPEIVCGAELGHCASPPRPRRTEVAPGDRVHLDDDVAVHFHQRPKTLVTAAFRYVGQRC